jgi:hypothetical protein
MPIRLRKRDHFFHLIHLVPARRTWIARNSPARNVCASSKDYLHCVLSLEKATIICRKRGSPRLERKRTRTPIVNSRNALRTAQALAGFRACVRAVSLGHGGLPMGQAPAHCESVDRPDPGGSRV